MHWNLKPYRAVSADILPLLNMAVQSDLFKLNADIAIKKQYTILQITDIIPTLPTPMQSQQDIVSMHNNN